MTIDYIVREPSGVYIPRQSGSDREFQERIAELEFALEDRDWILLGDYGTNTELSRQGLQEIARLARIMYIKNPLIQRGVNVASDYIWGRSVNISAKQEELNDVIQAFLNDLVNQAELTSQQSRIQKDRELRVDGNVFLVLFVHPITGHVRIGSIPNYEIVDIVTDPNNRKKPRYYKRQWTEQQLNEANDSYETITKTAYYQDWRYEPQVYRSLIGTTPVVRERVMHIKVGGFSDWKFGVSEVYAAIDWAKAYKTFLENWSTIVAAYARFAFKVTTTGGKQGIAQAKTKLATTLSTTDTERNPPPVVGSSFVRSKNVSGVPEADIEPIRTAGAQTSADDARRLLLMVAAAFGLPESFFGDVQGTFATADALDRPTELAFVNRQSLWSDVYHQLLDFVIYWAIAAVQGPLRSFGQLVINEYGELVIQFNDEFNSHIDVDFPSIIVHSIKDQMSALVLGATFDGKPTTIIPDNKQLAKMALTILGENDIDELLDQLYPPDQVVTERELNQAVIDFKEAIASLSNVIANQVAQ